jgi:hypothetical protein
MNLGNQFLDEWFINYKNDFNDSRDFPYGYDYPGKYRELANKLNTWVHPWVNQGAMLSDGGFLTDHGPAHIATVIKRAGQLVTQMPLENRLLPYEVFMLLMAIHVHDVGNIRGRNGHETNSIDVINQLRDTLTNYDRIEWAGIYDIAQAHGGEEKDKISKLQKIDPISGFEIRFQLLAAILKLADELAEDSSRAARYIHFAGELPEYSVLFHEYALALHTVTVKAKDREISMYFNIEEDKLHKKYKKKQKDKTTGKIVEIEQYLMDEIYLRTLKTHYERLYCMRFLRPHNIHVDRVRVSIDVSLKNNNTKFPRQGYDLIETGITDIHMDQIFEMCPELRDRTGTEFSKLVKRIQMP